MRKSKAGRLVGSIVWIFILVYGTALVFNFLFGGYMFERGLTDLNYVILAFLCAVPFLFISLIAPRKDSANNGLFLSVGLFSVLFVLVHLVMVLSAGSLQADAVLRTLIVFPISAFILAATVFFTAKNKKVSER